MNLGALLISFNLVFKFKCSILWKQNDTVSQTLNVLLLPMTITFIIIYAVTPK